MQDYTFKDFLPAIAIFGPIIAAVITLLVTRRWQKSKQITFRIGQSEDLTLPLKQSQQGVIVEIGHYRGFDLNRGVLGVKNSGHATVKNFRFQVTIPGEHDLSLAEVRAANHKLREAIQISRESGRAVTYNPVFNVTVPFFNPGEVFELLLFFDKMTVGVDVSCRMEEVNVKTRAGIGEFAETVGRFVASFVR